jgi:hypothetical protein
MRLPSGAQRLGVQPVECPVVSFGCRVVVYIGIVDRIAVLRAVLFDLVANASCIELGAQLSFRLRRQIADAATGMERG